jgi:hypothetical protein
MFSVTQTILAARGAIRTIAVASQKNELRNIGRAHSSQLGIGKETECHFSS